MSDLILPHFLFDRCLASTHALQKKTETHRYTYIWAAQSAFAQMVLRCLCCCFFISSIDLLCLKFAMIFKIIRVAHLHGSLIFFDRELETDHKPCLCQVIPSLLSFSCLKCMWVFFSRHRTAEQPNNRTTEQFVWLFLGLAWFGFYFKSVWCVSGIYFCPFHPTANASTSCTRRKLSFIFYSKIHLRIYIHINCLVRSK